MPPITILLNVLSAIIIVGLIVPAKCWRTLKFVAAGLALLAAERVPISTAISGDASNFGAVPVMLERILFASEMLLYPLSSWVVFYWVLRLIGLIPGLRWLKRVPLWSFGTVGLLLGFYAIMLSFMQPVVRHVTIQSPRVQSEIAGFKIVYLADMYLGHFVHNEAFARRLIERVNALEPDLVIFGGNMVAARSADYAAQLLTPFSQIRARYGSYSIKGGDDFFLRSPSYGEVCEMMHVHDVTNAHSEIRPRQMCIVGIPDGSPLDLDIDLKLKRLASICANCPCFNILLATRSESVKLAQKYNFALQLTGGAQDGQNLLISKFNKRRKRELGHGLYRLEPHTSLYISAGIGAWPALPFRTFIPEMTLITLQPSESK